jgi:tetratricopeptide (TPR) repeat protein
MWWIVPVTMLLLAACSSDPNKEKRAYLTSGDKYSQRGKYQEAVIQFRNAIQIDPKFGEAHWHLARAYLSLGNGEAAFRELGVTLGLEPQNQDARLELAGLLLARRQYDDAEAAVRQVLKAAPSNARAHALLGEKYLATHDREKAVEELRIAVDDDPKQVESYAALGAAYMAAGQTADGEATYKKAVEVNPRSVQAHVALGQFWFSQRKIADAEAEMRTAADLDPHAVLPRLLLARILAATNRREEAAAEYESLLKSNPKETAVKANLIAILIDLKRMKEAQALNREVLKDNPGDPQALLSQGRLLMAEGKYREASAALQAAIKSEPNCARCYFVLGSAQEALGLNDLAKDSLARARQLAPQMPGATAELAHLDAKSGAYGDALLLASNALQANPDLVSAYVTEARALISKGELSKAEAVLEEALKRDSANLPAVATILSLYTHEGKTQAAAARISKLVDANPQNAGLHVLLGVACLNLRDFDKSEANARQALSLDPKAKDAYTLLGNIDLARGDFAQAKTHFRAAIDANPNGLINYLALATLYEKDGNWEEAKKLCEKARGIDNASPIVANHLASLYLDHGGDINLAVSLAQVAKQKMPESPATTDTLGWAYYKLGSTKAALAELTESAKKAPRMPEYQYHLGMAYLADNRLDLARQSLQAALSIDPRFPDAGNARAALDQVSKSRQQRQ